MRESQQTPVEALLATVEWTKREIMSLVAMHAMLSGNPEAQKTNEAIVASCATGYADRLLEDLNKTMAPPVPAPAPSLHPAYPAGTLKLLNLARDFAKTRGKQQAGTKALFDHLGALSALHAHITSMFPEER